MKAPNGKPTNLNEVQWVQTRTPAFLKWFGDSNSIDDNGDPKVFFHATSADFNEFKNKTPVAGRIWGDGYYFTEDEDDAEYWKSLTAGKNGNNPKIIEVFLKTENPLEITGKVDDSISVNQLPDDVKEMLDNENELEDYDESRLAEYAAWSDRDSIVSDYLGFKHTVVFDASQIKSATNNTGTFSQESNDIRYSIADDIRESVSPKNRDTAIYYLQDKFIDLKRRMEAVVKNGGIIKESENARLAEELYHKRLAQRQEDFMADEMSPILNGLHKEKIGIEDFQKFLQAKHAPSRNAEMALRNPNQAMIDASVKKYTDLAANAPTPKERAEAGSELKRWNSATAFNGTEAERNALSGMSNQEAQKFIGSKSNRVAYERLAKQIYDINSKTLDLQVAYGLETQKTIDDLRNQWDFYVPLYRDEAHPEDSSHPIGQGFNVRGSTFKNATGSNAEVTNILAHITEQREQVLTRGEKSRVNLRFAEFLKAHPEPDFAVFGKVPMVDRLVNGFVKTVPDPFYTERKNILMIRDQGKDVSIEFNQYNDNAKRLALSLKNLDGNNLDMVENIIAKGTRWLAAVNTQYNLVFGVFNLTRDAQGAILNLSSTPIANKKKDVMTAIFPAMKAIYGVARGTDNSAMAKLYKEFRLAGGTTGFRDLFTDIKDRQKSLEKELKKNDSGRLVKVARATIDWLSDFNTVMENSVRLATYKAARDAGHSQDVAAGIAKNITVNFNRKGAATTKIGAFYAFFNASAQGTARMYETLSGPAGKQIIAGGVSLGAIVAMAGIAAMGDDDWEKIPEYIRERSLIIPTGGSNYISIPYPLGFHILPNIGRKTVEAAFGSNRVKPMARFGTLLEEIIDAFNPLGGKDIGQVITPTVADPVAALWRNRDWTGKTIYKEDFSSLDPTPGFSRAKDTATSISKGIAKGINAVSGGTDYNPGFWSPTPDQIDYIFGQLSGGTGREILHLQELASASITGEELPLRKVPLVGKLFGETSGNYAERELYYNNLRLLNQHNNEIEGLKKEPGGFSKVSAYLKENPDAKLYLKAKLVKKTVDKLMKQKKLVKSTVTARLIDNRIGGEMKKLNDLVINAID